MEHDELNKALFEAVKNNNHEEIVSLIKQGANVNAVEVTDPETDYGMVKYKTPLHYVESAEVAKTLIESGANVGRRDEWGDTPLHVVKNAEVAKVLIEAGADVNAVNEMGVTPLFYVRDVETTRVLIEAGADVNARDDDNRTPLFCVEDVESVRCLIEAGANVNVADYRRYTPLFVASNAEVAKVLIEAGADVKVELDSLKETFGDNEEFMKFIREKVEKKIEFDEHIATKQAELKERLENKKPESNIAGLIRDQMLQQK